MSFVFLVLISISLTHCTGQLEPKSRHNANCVVSFFTSVNQLQETIVPVESINISILVSWKRPKNDAGTPYKWGDGKRADADPSWSKTNVIYRWVRNSTGKIAQEHSGFTQVLPRVYLFAAAGARSEGSLCRERSRRWRSRSARCKPQRSSPSADRPSM